MFRAAGRMWLHDWAFLRDLEGGSTDAKGWSYHVLADRYADTGVTGEAQANGLNAHRARGRVWFRVAATPRTALEVEVRLKVKSHVMIGSFLFFSFLLFFTHFWLARLLS